MTIFKQIKPNYNLGKTTKFKFLEINNGKAMKNILFKFLFSLSSFSGVLMFLCINRNIDVPFIKAPEILISNIQFVIVIKFLLIFLGLLAFAKFVLIMGKKKLEVEGAISNIEKIKPLEGQYLPVYIGLFVIALSFNDGLSIQAIFLIFILFILWLFLESIVYFNPFFIILGYRFYEIETKNKITSIIITKKRDLKKVDNFQNLIRLNNFTFLEY